MACFIINSQKPEVPPIFIYHSSADSKIFQKDFESALKEKGNIEETLGLLVSQKGYITIRDLSIQAVFEIEAPNILRKKLA